MITTATSKAAQAGKVKQTCTGCGLSKPIASFELHGVSKQPLKVCDLCMVERRAAGGRRRSETMRLKREAKQREARRLERIAQEAGLSGEAETKVHVAPPPAKAATQGDTTRSVDSLALGRLIGFAEGLVIGMEQRERGLQIIEGLRADL